jgi:phospholipid transport system substrate-binding protein
MRPSKIFIATLSLFLLLATARADEQSAAVALVERIHQAASGNSPTALRAAIDAPAIARKVLGPYWQSADAAARQKFTEALTDVIVAALVRRFSGQGGDFTVLGSRKLGNGDILVSTRMTRPDSRMTNLDWRTHLCHAGPCVADVLVDGASVAIQRRDEYAARMQANGGSIADLIDSLRRTSP